MKGVMEELGVEIPPFILHRRIRVSHTKEQLRGTFRACLVSFTCFGLTRYLHPVEAIDVDGTPLSLFSVLKAQFLPSGKVHRQDSQSVLGRMETAFFFSRAEDLSADEVKVVLQFIGHYREPNLRFAYKVPCR